MGKKNKLKKERRQAFHVAGQSLAPDTVADKKIKTGLCILIALFAFLLYAQTISFNYAYDDYTVIKVNTLVKKGVSGIPQLLKTDYWAGFSDEFVKDNSEGLIYRPASLVMFALEWELFPDNPHINHFMNVLIYALTCVIVFVLLTYLFSGRSLFLPFACALLFAAHPIHTEVVSNIKSRDELLCFLFAALAMLFFLKYYLKGHIVSLILGILFFFLSLVSKETGITYLVCIPLLLFVVDGFKIKPLAISFLALGACVAFYLILRNQLNIGTSTTGKISYFTNVIAAAENSSDRLATAFFILFRYIGLLIFPHPLSSDYSYAQIEIKHMGDPLVILSILLHVAAGIYAVVNIRKKSLIAFSILFYLITLAPVSNVLFLIGSTLGERFLYMPSLGFCIIMTVLLSRITNTGWVRPGYTSIGSFFTKHSSMLLVVLILLALYSLKTYTRSSDWKDNLSLFKKDAETSPKSSRMHYGYGASLITQIDSTNESSIEINSKYDTAIRELEKAIAIYPEYTNAYLSLGLFYKNLRNYKASVASYEKARTYDPDPSPNLFKNMGYVYLKNGQFDKAVAALDTFLLNDTATAEILNNRGSALFGQKKYTEALPVFIQANKMNPADIEILKNMGRCYIYLKQYDKAEEYFKRILAMEPNKSDNYQFLGLTYQLMNDSARGNPLMRQYEAMKAAERK